MIVGMALMWCMTIFARLIMTDWMTVCDSSHWSAVSDIMLVSQPASDLQSILSHSVERREEFCWDAVFDELLGDTKKIEKTEDLPDTGMDSHVETCLSSTMIEAMDFKGRQYGTRSKTVVIGWNDGRTDVREVTLPSSLSSQPQSVSESFVLWSSSVWLKTKLG